MGLSPQLSPGLRSQICSQVPLTQRSMRQPISGMGFRPQVRFCAGATAGAAVVRATATTQSHAKRVSPSCLFLACALRLELIVA